MPSIFSLSIPHLREWSRHQKVDHRQQNEPVEAINRMMTGVGVPRQRGVPFVATGTVVAQFKLISGGEDYLVCRTWDGETEGVGDVFVAKPYMLRQTPFASGLRLGNEFRFHTPTFRTARHRTTGEEERQLIVPRYLSGDIIYATAPIRGGTGVVIGDEAVEWLDDNRDGRAWTWALS